MNRCICTPIDLTILPEGLHTQKCPEKYGPKIMAQEMYRSLYAEWFIFYGRDSIAYEAVYRINSQTWRVASLKYDAAIYSITEAQMNL